MRILGSGTPRLKRDLGYGCTGCQSLCCCDESRFLVHLRYDMTAVGVCDVPCSCNSDSNELDGVPLRLVYESFERCC